MTGATTQGMPKPKRVGRALGAVILLSLLTNLTYAQAMAGGYVGSDAGMNGRWRLLREAATWLIALWLLDRIARHKRLVAGSVQVATPVALAALFMATCIGKSLLSGTPLLAVATGLRIVPLLIILTALTHYSRADLLELVKPVAAAAGVFLLLEAAYAAYQVRHGVPALFGTTFLGPRPWGSTASPNTLGVAAAGVVILMVTIRGRWWRALAGIGSVLALVSGSRTAMLAVALVIFGRAAARAKARAYLVMIGLVGVYALYREVSTVSLSGRVIRSEGRLDVWRESLSVMDGPMDWLLGHQVGFGSNASITIYGSVADNRIITDSAVIGIVLSFGLAGLLLAVLGCVACWQRMDIRTRWIVGPAFVLMCLTHNVPEVAPLNILLTVSAGVGLRRCRCSAFAAVGERVRPGGLVRGGRGGGRHDETDTGAGGDV